MVIRKYCLYIQLYSFGSAFGVYKLQQIFFLYYKQCKIDWEYFIKTCKQNQNDMFFSVFLQTLQYFLNIEKNILLSIACQPLITCMVFYT